MQNFDYYKHNIGAAPPETVGYVVEDDVLVVIVLAIHKRERLTAYESALKRLMTKRV